MDWIKVLLEIKNKLSLHGYGMTVKRLNDAQMILGTPGEIYLEVMGELLKLRRESCPEYELVKMEVEELIRYGRSINYLGVEDVS
jgi:hypothetical protein